MGQRTIFRNGEKHKAHRDTLTRREMKRAARKLNREEKEAALRAKYGPSMKPAPVVIKRTGS